MAQSAADRFRVRALDVDPMSLTADEGWVDMEVRWLVAAGTVGSEKTVVGRTVAGEIR